MNDTERREFSRVDAFICLQTRRMSQDEKPQLRSWVSAELAVPQFPPLPELKDPALAEVMRIVNSKLDLIVTMLSRRDGEYHCLRTTGVNISGSGLSFESEELYTLGDLLELKMAFPENPDMLLCVYGEVVKLCPRESNGCKISVRFTVIDEDIRDKIVKYVFDKQREVIRNQRRL